MLGWVFQLEPGAGNDRRPGLRRFSQRASREEETLVLCYHGVSDRWPSDLAVSPARLRAQLEILLDQGYRPTTLNGAAVSEDPKRALVVTFDDGYRSVRELAFPIMRELGVPGTVFVVTRFVGAEEPMSWPGIEEWVGTGYEDELAPMTWEQLGELAADGWDIGSHTRSHPHLTTIEDGALAAELADSRADLEAALGWPCNSLAYPYGDMNPRVVAAAREAGYLTAVTIPGHIESTGRLEWPRVGIFKMDGDLRFRLKVSAFIRALRRSPVWDSLEPLEPLLRRSTPTS